jgi:hypothetical protein
VSHASDQSLRADFGAYSWLPGDSSEPVQYGFTQPEWDSAIGATAVAQVQVFNPVSWDLFTQYWDVKLTRVKKLPWFWNESSISYSPVMETGLYH